MKHKKGFTLLELLAVIIILAIIALISTPIIMRVIENSKKAAVERGAENYLRAVETQALALRGQGTILDGTYEIKANGNLCPGHGTDCDPSTEIKIEMSGKKPSSGSVVISNGKVIARGDNNATTALTIEDYTATINEGGSVIATKNDSESSTYTQVFKPQYYDDLSGNVGDYAPASPLAEPPSDKNVYLGYDVADGKVSTGYVCFVRHKKEYCLNGAVTIDENTGEMLPSPYYTINQAVIADAYEEVVDTNACSLGDEESYCDDGSSLYVFADSVGNLNVTGLYADHVIECYVNASSGGSVLGCYEP